MKQLLNEISTQDAYNKFYSTIPEEDFNMIISAAGTNKMNKTLTFILNAVKKQEIGVQQACDLLTTIKSKGPNAMQIVDNNIKQNKYATIQDLIADINNSDLQADTHTARSENGYEVLYEDEKCRITCTTSYEANHHYFGGRTEWCTASDREGKYNGFFYFGDYTGTLILINENYDFEDWYADNHDEDDYNDFEKLPLDILLDYANTYMKAYNGIAFQNTHDYSEIYGSFPDADYILVQYESFNDNQLYQMQLNRNGNIMVTCDDGDNQIDTSDLYLSTNIDEELLTRVLTKDVVLRLINTTSKNARIDANEELKHIEKRRQKSIKAKPMIAQILMDKKSYYSQAQIAEEYEKHNQYLNAIKNTINQYMLLPEKEIFKLASDLMTTYCNSLALIEPSAFKTFDEAVLYFGSFEELVKSSIKISIWGGYIHFTGADYVQFIPETTNYAIESFIDNNHILDDLAHYTWIKKEIVDNQKIFLLSFKNKDDKEFYNKSIKMSSMDKMEEYNRFYHMRESKLNSPKNILNEISTQDAYQKFYSDIPEEDFNMVIAAAGTNKMNKTLTFILNAIKVGQIGIQQAVDTISTIKSKGPNAMQIVDNNIKQNKYATIQDLIADVNNSDLQADTHAKRSEQGYEILYEDDNCRVTCTTSYEANHHYFGGRTEWCTASDREGKHNGFIYFGIYTETLLYLNDDNNFLDWFETESENGNISDDIIDFDDFDASDKLYVAQKYVKDVAPKSIVFPNVKNYDDIYMFSPEAHCILVQYEIFSNNHIVQFQIADNGRMLCICNEKDVSISPRNFPEYLIDKDILDNVLKKDNIIRLICLTEQNALSDINQELKNIEARHKKNLKLRFIVKELFDNKNSYFDASKVAEETEKYNQFLEAIKKQIDYYASLSYEELTEVSHELTKYQYSNFMRKLDKKFHTFDEIIEYFGGLDQLVKGCVFVMIFSDSVHIRAVDCTGFLPVKSTRLLLSYISDHKTVDSVTFYEWFKKTIIDEKNMYVCTYSLNENMDKFKVILNFKDSLTEASKQDIYQKFYADVVTPEMFNKITDFSPKKLLPIHKLILDAIKDGEISQNQGYNIIMNIYHKGQEKDTRGLEPIQVANEYVKKGKYKTIYDLIKDIEDSDFVSPLALKQRQSDGLVVINENEKWRLTCTLTYAANNHYFNGKTTWCTASDRDGRFDGYEKFCEYTGLPMHAENDEQEKFALLQYSRKDGKDIFQLAINKQGPYEIRNENNFLLNRNWLMMFVGDAIEWISEDVLDEVIQMTIESHKQEYEIEGPKK